LFGGVGKSVCAKKLGRGWWITGGQGDYSNNSHNTKHERKAKGGFPPEETQQRKCGLGGWVFLCYGFSFESLLG